MKVYASTQSSSNTDSAALSVDNLSTTASEVRASTGIAINIGQYSGYTELIFSAPIPANTSTYIKISTDDNILQYLLGGSLGELLTNVVGLTLSGSQSFIVQAKNGSSVTALTGNSTNAADFSTDRLRIVQNAAGDYFIKIMPDAIYDRVRLTNNVSSVLGLGTTKRLYVYEAFYTTGQMPPCTGPIYTSYSGSGITLSLLQAGATGVANPQNAINASASDYATLNIGTAGLAASMSQTVYFETSSNSTDTYSVTLGLSQALLNLNVLGNITITASNRNVVVQSLTLSELLALNVLQLQGGQPATLYMSPGASVDRITVTIASLASVSQSLNFYSVSRLLAAPVITLNNPVCQGSPALLAATSLIPDAQIKWFSSPAGGTPLVVSASGQSIATSAIMANSYIYVQQTSAGCSSALVPVAITAVTAPIPGTISGSQTVCLTNTPATLGSLSEATGSGISYRWESSANQSAWAVVPSATLPSYQPSLQPQSTFYRRITTVTVSGVTCDSQPSNVVEVTPKNCMVVSNPMIRHRIKNAQ